MDQTINEFIIKLKEDNKGFFESPRNSIGAEAFNKIPKRVKEQYIINPIGLAIFCWQSDGHKFTWINSFGELHTLRVDNHGEIEPDSRLNNYTSSWGVKMLLKIVEEQQRKEVNND